MARLSRRIESRTYIEKMYDWKPLSTETRSPHVDPAISTNPPCNDQVAFINSPAKERWNFAANRAGKTEVAVYDALAFATGEHPVRSEKHPPPVIIWFCAPTWTSNIVGVILRKIQRMVKHKYLINRSWEDSWDGKNGILTFNNRSEIHMKSGNQLLSTWGGFDIDAAYFDEHLRIDYFREVVMRLAERNGYFVGTMTPELGSIMWERRHILEHQGPDCEVFKWSIYGNPYVSGDGIKHVERTITDENLRRVKLYGDFVALAGMVYPMWSRRIHVIADYDIPKQWHRACILDSHLKKESAIVWIAYGPDEDIIVYRCAKVFKIIPELKAFIRTLSAGERIQTWVADESQGGAGKNIYDRSSVIIELNSGDDRLPFVGTNQASDRAFEAGIMTVRQMLTPDPVSGTPKLRVFRSCQGVVDEFEEYQFVPNSAADEMTFRERVRSVFDDYMACVRYGVMARPMLRSLTMPVRYDPESGEPLFTQGQKIMGPEEYD